MRRALPLLLLIALPLAAADNVYQSPIAHQCLVDLLRKSGWGLAGPFERAAFITEQLDGTLGCQEWPSMHTYHTEQFHGGIPPQAIAIVHTHPVQFPKPSEEDAAEATRLGIPIYTITIRGVYKSEPGAQYALVITDKQSWIRETPGLTAPLRADKLSIDVKSDGLANK
jgi:hypothetical protein